MTGELAIQIARAGNTVWQMTHEYFEQYKNHCMYIILCVGITSNRTRISSWEWQQYDQDGQHGGWNFWTYAYLRRQRKMLRMDFPMSVKWYVVLEFHAQFLHPISAWGWSIDPNRTLGDMVAVLSATSSRPAAFLIVIQIRNMIPRVFFFAICIFGERKKNILTHRNFAALKTIAGELRLWAAASCRWYAQWSRCQQPHVTVQTRRQNGRRLELVHLFGRTGPVWWTVQ